MIIHRNLSKMKNKVLSTCLLGPILDRIHLIQQYDMYAHIYGVFGAETIN